MCERTDALQALTAAAANLAGACRAHLQERMIGELDNTPLATELHRAFRAGAAVPADFSKLMGRMK